MNAGEIRELGIDELTSKIRETRDELFNAKVKHATGQLEDTARLGKLRRNVARLNSVLSEKCEATK